MNTQNIISTPNITGNIGSCSSQVVSAVSGRTGILTIEKTNIVTNSCTGSTTKYTTWDYSGAAGWVLTGLVAVVCFTILLMFAVADSRRSY